MSTASTPATAAPCRPWYRLHFSTWIVCIFGLLVTVLLIVPGEEGWWPWEGSLHQERAVLHGWPWLYLWRTPQPWWTDPSASRSFAWNIGDAVKQFRLIPLVADVALFALCATGVAALWEWRRRQRRRLQFSLRSLLLFVTFVAVGLRWWGFQLEAARQLSEHLKVFNSNPFETVRPTPRFPLWARVAIGDEHLLPLGIDDLGLIAVNWAQTGSRTSNTWLTTSQKRSTYTSMTGTRTIATYSKSLDTETSSSGTPQGVSLNASKRCAI